jgi:cell pole-organizing protein PopZ
MSTGNPHPQHPSLESEQRAHEPSMEEILASIRRIIADDDALPLMRRASLVSREPAGLAIERPYAPPVHLVAVPPAVAESEDAAPATAPHSDSPDRGGEEYVSRDHAADARELRAAIREHLSDEAQASPVTASNLETRLPPSPAFAHDQQERERTALLSASTDASVASSFQSLTTSMFLRDSDLIARTAREMLRPMLKQWLDENLPVMVERLVRAEIERVARGGR